MDEPARMTRRQATDALREGDRDCLIHSGQRGLWWAPGRRGYTGDRAQAGRYRLSEALEITSTSGPEKAITFEPLETAA